MKERVLCACSGSLLVWGVAQKGDVHTTDKQDSGSQNRFVEARLLKANSNGEDLNLVGLTGVKLSQRHSTSDRFMMMTSDEGGECNTVSHFKVLKFTSVSAGLLPAFLQYFSKFYLDDCVHA